MSAPEIHRRGNRWIGRMNGQFAWGRSFAECGLALAVKCPELLFELADLIEQVEGENENSAGTAAQERPMK